MRIVRAVFKLRCVHHGRRAMTVGGIAVTARTADVADFTYALNFAAPYLVEKLLKDGVVESAFDADALFTEVKRYLVLTRLDPHISWQMYSTRVDEVWHQFVLYTGEYAQFCERSFGEFVHHRPNNAPATPSGAQMQHASFHAFADRYREVFVQELPDQWFDERSVTIDRRVINEKAGRLTTSESTDRVSVVDDTDRVLFSVDSLAAEAVRFLVATKTFYVRELPGDLTDDERIGIVATLVAQRLLRVAS